MLCCLTLLWKTHSVVIGYSEGPLLPSFFMALSHHCLFIPSPWPIETTLCPQILFLIRMKDPKTEEREGAWPGGPECCTSGGLGEFKGGPKSTCNFENRLSGGQSLLESKV